MRSSTTTTTQTTTKATSLTSKIDLSIRVELRRGNKSLLWDPVLTNNISAVYNATSERTCDLIKAAARFTTSLKFEITFCNILRFYPGSILAEAIITVNSTDNNVSQTQILQAIQNGAQLYLMNQTNNMALDSSQIMSIVLILQKQTCSTLSKTCSPHSDCFETPDGAYCSCKPMWTDLNPRQPGIQCVLSPAAIALIVLAAIILVIIITLTIYFVLRSTPSGERFMYSFV
ncbi:unnamed protein product [Trichobilharzia szidati]|nr:unnamed protein product [Trichobilharzia szidati]CAH8848857.1 unnamed protein product [Trichobilharzia szidati]